MTTVYTYSDLAQVPCLAYLQEMLPQSAMTNKNMTNISYHYEQLWLKIWYDPELSAEDEDILTDTVNDSLGLAKIVKSRETIMAEILTLASPDPTQLNRLLDALDGYPSVAIALDNYNYALARMRVEKVYVEEAVTLADRDLVLSTIPTADYEAV